MQKFKFIVVLLCVVAYAGVAGAQTPATESLQQKLASSDPAAQLEACQQIEKLGIKAKDAVPQLVTLLQGKASFELKRCATLALAAIGEDAKAAVPTLQTMLKSKEPKLRAYAAYALGRIGESAADAVPDLIQLITDKNIQVRRAVRDALPRIGVQHKITRPLLIKVLKNAQPQDAAAAIATIAELGDKVVPDLCEALGDKNACYWACLALADLGPKAKTAIPQLAKLLDSEQPDVRMQALLTLAEIGPAAKSLAPRVAQVLTTDKFESVQYAAAYALGRFGDKSVVPALEKVLDSKDAFLRVAAAWSLLRLQADSGPGVDKAVQIILQGIQSKDTNVRDAAARALADDSIPAKGVTEAFRKALEGIHDPAQMEEIAHALASAGEKIVPACIRSLNEQGKLRFYALRVLTRLGPKAADAVPALIKTLNDPDPKLRREAEFALGAIGPQAAAAVPSLIERLDDEDDAVRYAACYALGKIGSAARPAVKSLIKIAMHPKDPFSRVAAVWAILQIVPDNPRFQRRAVPILTRALASPRAHVRAAVAGQLGDIGALAAPALDALKKLAEEDDNAVVRRVAEEAIAKIKKASKN